MKYTELEAQMTYEGYRLGGLNQIDIEVCAESSCTNCGHEGLKYAGFEKDGSYRAFSVCPKCDEAEEF